MSSDLSGEITAIATAVLAAFAIITAAVAYMAFRRQAQEVAILQQQMKEQQDVLAHEARERYRAQASRVFISVDYHNEQPAQLNVFNTSDQPVYDAEIQWRDTRIPVYPVYPVPRNRIGTILPGDRAAVEWQPRSTLPRSTPARITTIALSSAFAALVAARGCGRCAASSSSRCRFARRDRSEPRAPARRLVLRFPTMLRRAAAPGSLTGLNGLSPHSCEP